MGPGHEKDMLGDINIERTEEQLLESSGDDSDSQSSDGGQENNRRVKNQSTKMTSKAKCEPFHSTVIVCSLCNGCLILKT